MRKLPDKTVERLSQYRRTLRIAMENGKMSIFSHELAALLHITSVQVRRDIMLMGYSGTLRQGYDVKDLIDRISKIIDTKDGQRVAVIGTGNLGRAIIGYFNAQSSKLKIVAAFDINEEKINREFAGVRCYHIDKMPELIKTEGISIAVITVPADVAVEVTAQVVKAGIKGILNFTSKPLIVPSNVYLEQYDIITSLEKVAYFVKR